MVATCQKRQVGRGTALGNLRVILERSSQEVLKAAWGTVPPDNAPWLSVRLAAESDLVRRVHSISFRWDVTSWHRVVHGVHVQIAESSGGVNLAVSDLELCRAVDATILVQEMVSKTIVQLSPYLHEFDPRIGTVLDSRHLEETFPPCPLFSGGTTGYLRRKPLWVESWMTLVEMERWSKAKHGLLCPVCRSGFTTSDPPMWAGGNAHWMHVGCWQRLYHRLSW
jgi:hypothetical protein